MGAEVVSMSWAGWGDWYVVRTVKMFLLAVQGGDAVLRFDGLTVGVDDGEV